MFNLFTELLLLNNCPISSVLLYRNGPELTSPDFFIEIPREFWNEFNFYLEIEQKILKKSLLFVVRRSRKPPDAARHKTQERQLLRVRLIYSVSGNSARKTSNYYQKWPKSTTKIVFKVINSTAFISGNLSFWIFDF